jgi:accessory gene regulator protein AgrB
MFKFITKSMHAWLDYPVALGLIAMPFILGLGAVNPLALWLSVAVGVGALVVTLLTDHQFGLIRVLPFKLHLAVDLAAGIVFLVAPFALGFTGLEAVYYWALGATVVAVVGLDTPEQAPVAA